jgi:flagellar hook protein FlgE
LFAGVSGLQSQSSAMGAIADNVTNVNTVGYKGTNVNFKTLVTKQVSSTKYSPGGVQSAPRKGVDVQGLLQATTSSTDLGISGKGFFVVSDQAANPSGFGYSRAGSFKVDKDGYLQNVSGYYLQGWPLENWDGTQTAATVEKDGNVYMKSYKNSSGDTYYMNDNAVDATNLQALNLQTIGGTARATSTLALGANLPGATNVEIGTTAKTNALIFDTLGNSHNLDFTWAKRASNSWDLQAMPPAGSTYVAIQDQSTPRQTAFSAGRLDFTGVPADGTNFTVDFGGSTWSFGFDSTVADFNMANAEAATTEAMTVGTAPTALAGGEQIVINGVTFTLTSTATAETDIDISGLTTITQLRDQIVQSTESYFDTKMGAGNWVRAGSGVDDFQSVFDIADGATPTGWATADVDLNDDGTDNLAAKTFNINTAGKSLSQILDQLGAQMNTALALENGGAAPPAPPGSWGGRISGENGLVFRQFDTTNGMVVDASGLTKANGDPAILQSSIFTVPNISAAVAWTDKTKYAVKFNGDGSIDKIFGKDETDEPDPRIQLSIGWANGAEDMDGSASSAISMFIGNYNSKDGLQQLADDYQLNYLSQNGNKFGNFAGVSIGEDGIVTALFDNGVTTPIFMIPLATFVNPNGMESVTGNVFQQTDTSGLPTIREAGSAGSGVIAGGTLEGSTVDLGEEFTSMITTQRAYSAAAKIITTSDEMLDELIRIKR